MRCRFCTTWATTLAPAVLASDDSSPSGSRGSALDFGRMTPTRMARSCLTESSERLSSDKKFLREFIGIIRCAAQEYVSGKSQINFPSAMLFAPMHTFDSLEPRRLLSFSFAYAAAFGDQETLDSGNAVVVDAAGNTYFGGTFRGEIDVNKSNHGVKFFNAVDDYDAFLV